MSSNYHNKAMTALWNDVAPGFYNYGRIDPTADPEKIPDLRQSNEDMIHYMIDQLGITKDSCVLEMGCGKGMNILRVAEITGCEYTGVDMNTTYLEEYCRKFAKERGLEEQGDFVQGSVIDLPAKVRDRKYTHVISLSVQYYVHNHIMEWLENLASVVTEDSKIFIMDYCRKADWSYCSDFNRHLKLPFPMLTKEEVFANYIQSKLEMYRFEDATDVIIPGYAVMERECFKRDPEMETLTYPLVGQAFRDGLLQSVYFYLRLKRKMNLNLKDEKINGHC